MQYFSDNLSEKELKAKYRKLAKQYHPDVCHDANATAIMAEINHQFDEYFTNQKLREYSWVDTFNAKREAKKVRKTILIYLLRNREIPGTWFAYVKDDSYNSAIYRDLFYWSRLTGVPTDWIKVVTSADDPAWTNFRGGLAYCTYDRGHDGSATLCKLPATITPANEMELYWYLRDHWLDTKYDTVSLIRTRFGDFWTKGDGYNAYRFYVKVELPKEFVEIENGKMSDATRAEYAARSIDMAYVKSKWVQEARILDTCTGEDFRYRLFLECTASEFRETHDVDWHPDTRTAMWMREKPIPEGDLYFINDPVIWYCAKHGIINFYSSRDNFRIRYGTFSSEGLRKNIHLISVEDAELIQDYLDEMNDAYEDEVKRRIKSGKIKLKI